MQDKQKRILWILNHTTLREFEVSLLKSLGFEVYTSKIFPFGIGFRSSSNDYQLDKDLTLPPEIITCLNEYNFYGNEMPQKIKKIINDYFGTAFVTVSDFSSILINFHGRIVIRAFGTYKSQRYSRVLNYLLNDRFDALLKKMQNRLWFSYAYETILDREPDCLKNASVFLPIGIPHSLFEKKNTWNGEIKKIFFVCPTIGIGPYYREIYRKFKKKFGKFPHVIGGSQPTFVSDPAVLGTLPRNEFDEYLKNCRVMFYHSDEPGHLHYHPLEAIIFGMPVIFMSQGVLGTLDDPKNQPGSCRTIREAKKKIKRILNDDWDLIHSIQVAQQKLLEPFTASYIKPIWQANLIERVMQIPPHSNTLNNRKPKRIGVFLPQNYQGGTLNAAKSIAKMLKIGSHEKNRPIEVVFSYIPNDNDKLSDLKALGVELRETTWKDVTRADVELINEVAMDSPLRDSYFKPLSNAEYLMPCDGMVNFSDCDFWLIVSDRTLAPIAPIKPYGIVIYDYIQRYVKNSDIKKYNYHYFQNARAAQFVLTSTPQTRDDCIQYAGVSPHKVHLTPIYFDPFYKEIAVTPLVDENYFLWTTNIASHKNHQNALEALDYYYNDFQGNLNVVMTGVNTENFDLRNPVKINHPYVRSIRSLLKKNETLFNKHLQILGNLSVDKYISVLTGAKFLWHPATIDNGTFSVVEAAYYGVPSLSSDYPQMRYLNEYFKLNLTLSTADDPMLMAKKLKEMELSHLNLISFLPSKESLDQFSYKNLAGSFFETIENLL